MRIVSWNCCGSSGLKSIEAARRQFVEKLERALALTPDILVLQECPKEDALKVRGYSLVWRGEMFGRGICIAVSSEVPSLRLIRETRSSVTVQCGDTFVVGVWSLPSGNADFQKYVNEVGETIDANREILATGNAILIGDFNGNACWDDSTRKFRHTDNVNQLETEFGLKSAYHSYFECEQGAELHPTFFMHRSEKKPFHIDYCFVPAEWKLRNVVVGGFGEWSKSSDHCPVIVDFERL